MRNRRLEALKMIEEEAEHLVVISTTGSNAYLWFSDDMDDMDILDLLTFVTARFYENAEEPPSNLH